MSEEVRAMLREWARTKSIYIAGSICEKLIEEGYAKADDESA